MLETIDGQEVYVVDFDTMPELPITWDNSKEKPYAMALQDAIQEGLITEPGTYGIQLVTRSSAYVSYTIAKVIEK